MFCIIAISNNVKTILKILNVYLHFFILNQIYLLINKFSLQCFMEISKITTIYLIIPIELSLFSSFKNKIFKIIHY